MWMMHTFAVGSLSSSCYLLFVTCDAKDTNPIGLNQPVTTAPVQTRQPRLCLFHSNVILTTYLVTTTTVFAPTTNNAIFFLSSCLLQDLIIFFVVRYSPSPEIIPNRSPHNTVLQIANHGGAIDQRVDCSWSSRYETGQMQ